MMSRMRILWITNTLFPDACGLVGIKQQVVGGWMFSLANDLLKKHTNLDLAVATTYNGKLFIDSKVNGIRYFLVPIRNKLSYSEKLEGYWKNIHSLFNPSVVHIHGSEYPVGLAYINACGNLNVIVSIQGLISVIHRYYLGGLKHTEILSHITLRDLLKVDTLYHQLRNIELRGILERQLLKKTQNIIGRTAWDRSHTNAINPQAKYYFCNETLRKGFYSGRWSIDNCERYRIFVSQAQYPLKGFHQLLKALPLLKEKYPDIKVIVAGNDFVNRNFLLKKTYDSYLNSLINKNGLKGVVVFTGELSEEEIIYTFLKSHLFICPSSIENSSNSVGEAQILGVPVIASYVGGMPDLVSDNTTGLLYRYEEIEMLASQIDRIFSDDSLALRLSTAAREQALKRHNRENNVTQLYSAYEEMFSAINIENAQYDE